MIQWHDHFLTIQKRVCQQKYLGWGARVESECCENAHTLEKKLSSRQTFSLRVRAALGHLQWAAFRDSVPRSTGWQALELAMPCWPSFSYLFFLKSLPLSYIILSSTYPQAARTFPLWTSPPTLEVASVSLLHPRVLLFFTSHFPTSHYQQQPCKILDV